MARSKHQVERIHTDLEIEEYLALQEKGWKLQIAGLIFMFTLVFTAAIGLYGDGWASKKKLVGNDLTFEYDQFYRFEARMELKLQLANTTDKAIVSFPARYLDHFKIETIVPEPSENKFDDNEVQYMFKGKESMFISFFFVPQKTGSINGSIRVNGDQFDIDHFIFP